jgi:RNA polymerase-associated protein RTF1
MSTPNTHSVKVLSVQIFLLYIMTGEVTDSEGSESYSSALSQEEFNDGYDENLMGDEEDQARLAQMTEKEREQEIFKRIEQREVMKTRYDL